MRKIAMKQKITSENLIENLQNIGPWSTYGLASIALQHYFPKEYDYNGFCETKREVELANKLGCQYWEDVIKKYQKEVGYNAPDGFNEDYVNEY